MRGNKRLIQGITVVSIAGVLVFSVNFSKPQIMQTEAAIQINQDGTAGLTAALASDEQIEQYLSQPLSDEKNQINQTSASDSKKNSDDSDAAGNTASDDKNVDLDAAAKDVKTATVDTKEKTTPESTKASEDAKTVKNVKTADEKKEAEATEKIEKKETENKKNTANTKEANTKESTEKEKTNSKKTKKSANKISNSVKKKWKGKLMADVDKALNIRKAESKDAEVVGKLRKGDVAKVLKKGGEWTKIESGNVKGYVSNDYCVYGMDAYKLAKKVCGTYASVKADGLRIRSKASEKATVLDAVYDGDKLKVNKKAKEKDGWVAVNDNGTKGYVSADYVKVALETGEAITIEEEQAQIAEQEKAERLANSQNATASSDSVAAVSSSVQASSDDLTLLSAIIYCEAGGERYEGQVAVGAVVMNRVKSSSYPNSISGVVYQSGQFTPAGSGALSRALSNGSYKNCISAAREALAGADNTGGAKYFHRVNGDAGLVIGNHVFY